MKKTVVFAFLLFNLLNASAQFFGISKHGIDSCSFETKCKIITLSDSVNPLWQIGKANKSFFDSTYAIMTDTLNSYPISAHNYFEIKIPNEYYSLHLSFRHKFQSDTLLDGGFIEVSTDNGHNWRNVVNDKPLMLFTEKMYSKTDSIFGGHVGFSGNSNGWINTIIQWVWELPQKKTPDTLMLRFHFISDSIDSQKSGWIIDDMVISWVYLGSSVKRIKSDTKLKYSPNPMTTETNFYFENSTREKYTLQLYNNNGQLVKTQSEYHPQSMTLKRENLNTGLYFFLLRSESGVQSSGNLMVK